MNLADLINEKHRIQNEIIALSGNLKSVKDLIKQLSSIEGQIKKLG